MLNCTSETHLSTIFIENCFQILFRRWKKAKHERKHITIGLCIYLFFPLVKYLDVWKLLFIHVRRMMSYRLGVYRFTEHSIITSFLFNDEPSRFGSETRLLKVLRDHFYLSWPFYLLLGRQFRVNRKLFIWFHENVSRIEILFNVGLAPKLNFIFICEIIIITLYYYTCIFMSRNILTFHGRNSF